MARLLASLLLAAAALARAAASAPAARPPNVILFLVDDLGWSDLGIHVPIMGSACYMLAQPFGRRGTFANM